MSLRSVGNQLLQTAPSPLLAGASTASLSLWIRVNPGCNVANPGGVNIFGDMGGKLSATLTGSGSLQLGWSSTNGTTNGHSTCSLTLAPGTSYHLAATWQDGSQNYFVNGVEIDSDTQLGSIGVPGDAAPHSFRLGSDSAGTDVTLDEPTLWVGYALSVQDVRDLRDRIVHPEGIAPASIALQWSLAGADGVAARVGDAGLADSSATGLNLSSIVGAAPTYQAGVLSYAPVAAIGTASVGPSGQSIVVVVEDGTGAPANVRSLKPADNVQSLSLSGTPAGGGFTLTFGGQTTAMIPVRASVPLAYGTWTASVAPGVAQQIATTWAPFAFESRAQLFEVFDSDGTTLLGSVTFDMTANPGWDFTDGMKPDGFAENWKNIGIFTPTGARITVRITAPYGEQVLADGLWVKDTATGVVQYLDNGDNSAFAMIGTNLYTNTGQTHWFNGNYTQADGMGVGARYLADPAAIQAALLGLSSVRAGGLTVSAADGNNSGPYTVRFGGPMGGVPQPPLIASDPAVVPSIAVAGGDLPSIRINGGAPIPLENPVWGVGLPNGAGNGQVGPYLPYVMWPLPQSPGTQITAAFSGLFSYTGGKNFGVAGYSRPTLAMAGSDTATFLFPCQPAGTYRVSATWAASGSLSTTAGLAITNNAGTTLATVVLDQTVPPADFTDAGVGWKILGTCTIPTNTDIAAVLNAGGASVLADAARLDRVGPDTSILIKSTDVVTMSVSDGWASTAAGPVDGATSLPLRNPVGGSLLPNVTGRKSMRVGYNVVGSSYSGWFPVHSDLAKGIDWSGVYQADADGYPTAFAGPYFDVTIYEASSDFGGKGKSVPAIPFGDYTVVWDGACDVEMRDGSPLIGQGDPSDATFVTSVSSNLTGTIDNKRVFGVRQNDYASLYSPVFSLRVHGTSPDPSDTTGQRHLCDLRNLRIYPPDVDPANPPLFHPSFVSKLQGVGCIRFMDPLGTNGGNIHDFADFHTSSDASYLVSKRRLSIPAAEIAGYKGDASGFDNRNGVIVQVTTGLPHGLATGQYGQLTNTGTAEVSNESYSTSFNLGYAGSVVQVISPTVFLIGLSGDSSRPGRVMTNTITGDACGQFQVNIGGGGMAFTDCVALCNQVGADLYLNIPPPASDDCVSAMAGYVAANLKSGLKARVEYANECWNYGFPAYASCCTNSVIVLGTDANFYLPYYVYRTKQVHDLCLAAFAAAGRAGDLLRVMGSQGANPGITSQLVNYANQYGATFDELAVAPYLENYSVACGSEPTLTPAYNLMTTDQNLDLFELNVLYGGTEGYVGNHRSILDNGGFRAAKIICYEGGPEYSLPGGSTADYNRRSRAVVRHPRMFGVMFGFLQKLQDAGCSLFNDYTLNYYVGPPVWGVYYGRDMQPGTGDPGLDAINITDPEALDQIKSEVGGAMNLWASLSGGGTPPKPKRTIPGRNGQIKATGFPRGLFRPTR